MNGTMGESWRSAGALAPALLAVFLARLGAIDVAGRVCSPAKISILWGAGRSPVPQQEMTNDKN